MYALIIGRAFPEEKTGMMGIFEFEQAEALNKYGFKSVYAFCDTRSVKRLRVFNYVNKQSNNTIVYGYHYPIGGLPRRIFDLLKKRRFEKLLNKIIEKEGKPSIIHIHFPLLTLNEEIWRLLKSLEIPLVLTEHWSKVQLKQIESYRVNFLRTIVEESDSYISVGEKLRQSVIELTNTDKDIQVIPNMVNPIFFYNKQVEEHKGNFTFTVIGRLVESKRIDFLIKAFSDIFMDNKNIYLNIIGDGPLFSKIKNQIQNLRMEERIKMHGFLSREKTANILKKSHVFVSASILETFGVPFIEALACGKPVIGIKNGPIDKYINDSNGILFEQDDINDLMDKLNEVYQNRDFYNGKQIANTTQKTFGERAIVMRMISIYTELSNKLLLENS